MKKIFSTLFFLLLSSYAWASFPTTGVLYSGTGSDVNPLPSSNFTQYNTHPLKVSSAQIVGTANGSNGALWTGGPYSSTEAYMTINTHASSTADTINLIANMSSDQKTGYLINAYHNTSTDNLIINRISNFVSFQIGTTFNHSIANGDSIGISAINGTVSMWYKSGGGAWVDEKDVTIYNFAVSGASASPGAKYTNNGITYTIAQSISGGSVSLIATSTTSGNAFAGNILTKTSGTGNATITFSSVSNNDYTSGSIGMYVSYASTSPGITNFGGGQVVTVSQGLEMTNNVFSGTGNPIKFPAGGTINMTPTLTSFNGDAVNTTGVLSSSDSCITVTNSGNSFGTIVSGGSGSVTPFSFMISSGCASGHLASLSYSFTDDGYAGLTVPIYIYINTPYPNSTSPPYSCSTNYYVSTNGQDGAAGTGLGTAWATLQNAITLIHGMGNSEPGVCVNVEPGTYPVTGGNAFTPGNSATGLGGANATTTGQLVFRSTVPFDAVIQLPYTANSNQSGAAGFTFDEASYLTIDGFTILGPTLPIQSGVKVNIVASGGVISSVILNSGGSGGNVVGDVLGIIQSGASFGYVTVTTINGSGVVTGISFTASGAYDTGYSTANGLNTSNLSFEDGININSFPTDIGGAYITTINNIVANHGAAGISAVHTDYLRVKSNIISGNCNYGPFEGSALSSYQAAALDANAGYHNIFDSNVILNNKEISDGRLVHTDGNGIIMDDFQNTQNSSAFGVYAPASLIQNNIIFSNGGGGIHEYLSNNITSLNNTMYGNYTDTLIASSPVKAEININTGINNTFVNNIAYAIPNPLDATAQNVGCTDASFGTANTGNVWYNNMCYAFNGTSSTTSTYTLNTSATITASTGNVITSDPKFSSLSSYNLTLQATSPAIGAGTALRTLPSADFSGNPYNGGYVNMGAYQSAVFNNLIGGKFYYSSK